MTARRRAAVLLGVITLAALVLSVAGCDGYTTALPTFDSPLNGTAQAIALERYATQSAAEVAAVEAQAQATVQAAIWQATVQSVEAQREQERQWATAQAAEATARAEATYQAWSLEATTQAWQATATADELNRQATATAQAWAWEATRQAQQATATQQALDQCATATAQYKADLATATVQAWMFQATATQAAWDGVRTATAESYRATQSAYQATATVQALQREAVLAYGRDYGVPAVLLVLLGCAVALTVYALRQYSKRPVVYKRNPLGDADPLAVPAPGGGWNLVDLDRQPGHVTRLLPDGTVDAPRLRSAGQEERTTARDQLVDATTRPRLGAGQKSGGQAPALPVAPPPTPPVPGLRSVRVLRRLDQAGRAGFLPGPLLASLEADWEEER